MVILPERGSERLADDVKCCTHIWNSLSSCTWRAGLLHKASAGTFSVSPVLFFLPRFLSQSLNLFLSLSLFTACRSAGMVTRCASAKKSEWTEAKGKRRDEAQEDSDMGEKYLPWSRREEVDNHIMSVSEEERGHEKKREGDGERESVTDAKREAERGLRSRNALTLETWLSVCIWHSTSCHSTGLSTHTPIYQHIHTHTHTSTVCFGWWSQEATPGEGNTFQGAINLQPHSSPPPHHHFCLPPSFPKVPSLLPSLRLALSAYLHHHTARWS